MDLGLRIACLQHVPFEGPGAIADWARRRHHRLLVTRLDAGDRLPVPSQFDWLVLMGGPMGVQDEASYPWMAREKALIREAIAYGKTVVGICLGAQLVASALGASVERGANCEIGWFPVSLTPGARNLPALANVPESFAAFHWHCDMFSLPPDATRLATSDGCPEQAFLLGNSVLGLQFHLEATRANIDGLLSHCADDLQPGPFVQDASTIRAGIAEHLEATHQVLDAALGAMPGAGTFLTTDRLRLRRMRPTDAEHIVRLDADPEVKRWIDQGRPPDAEHIRQDVIPRWVSMYEETGGLGFFAAEDRQTGEFLGWFHLKPWTADDGASSALELGYRLHRHRWGLGLATEGSRALIEVAFREFGVSRVVGRAMAANSSSIRVLEKCGLMFSHEYEEERFPGGDRTAVVYDLEAEDYEGPEFEY